MKTRISILLVALLITSAFAGCGSSSGSRSKQGAKGKTVDEVLQEQAAGETAEAQSSPATETQTDGSKAANTGKVDIDLTELSSTMVYSEVNNMITQPEQYFGKMVKMKGNVAMTQGNGRTYYACIISDATACCAQGIEFVLNDSYAASDYPAAEAEVTVTGVFDRYYEGDQAYFQLIDAVLG